MWMTLRQLVSIAVLPGMITIVVPWWIVSGTSGELHQPSTGAGLASMIVGVLCLATGLMLFVASLYQFWTRGRGTLAPWDPPRQFVVSGPYRFVRNPMISGVIFVLVGEAALSRLWALAAWAATFLAMNLVHIQFIEERRLVARFGEPYRDYCRHVRRFVPRLRPWTPPSGR